MAGGQGGGIYVSNDLTTVKNCAVFCNGTVRSGAGIWVDGQVDLITGGKLVVVDNFRTDGTEDNVFLENYLTGQEAHLIAKGLAKGSLLGITLDEGHSSKVACGPEVRVTETNAGAGFDQRMFFSDGNARYMYWNSETNPWYDSSISINKDRDDSSFDFRWIIAADSGKMPAGYSENAGPETAVFIPDEDSMLKEMDFTYEAGETSYPVYEGVFEMPVFTSSTQDNVGVFYYSDGYFMDDPAVYNPHLATLSITLATTCGYSTKGNAGAPDGMYDLTGETYYPIKTLNAYHFLSDIGVKDEDIYFNAWNSMRPERDSMGVTIGRRQLPEGKQLIIIGTRGIGYEAEWASNVTLGPSGEAAGFSAAADEVMRCLDAYAADREIDLSDENTLFWISGFSRAGATANLAAKRIIDQFDAKDRMFAYPMEAPKGGRSEEERDEQDVTEDGYKYAAIHNVVNIADIVPYVGPREMGFERYGVDHFMPGTDAGDIRAEVYDTDIMDAQSGQVIDTLHSHSRSDNSADNQNNALRAEMIRQLFAVNSDLVYDDYFYMATLNLFANTVYGSNVSSMISEINDDSPYYTTAQAFIPDFLANVEHYGFNYHFSGGPETNNYRHFYAAEPYSSDVTFENAASELCSIVFSLNKEEMDNVMEVFGNLMDRIDAMSLYMDYFRSTDDSWNSYGSYSDIADGKMNSIVADLWNKVATRDEQKGYKSLYDVLPAEQVSRIQEIWPSLALPLLYWVHTDYQYYDSDAAGTMAYNAMRILMNHYQEVVYSYLRASDSYFAGGTNDSYKKITYERSETALKKDPAVKVIKEAGEEIITGDDLDNPIVLVDDSDKLELIGDPSSPSDQVYYTYPEAETVKWRLLDKPLTVKQMRAEGVIRDEELPETTIRFYVLHHSKVSAVRDITVVFHIDGCVRYAKYSISDDGYGFQPMDKNYVPVGTRADLSAGVLIHNASGSTYKHRFEGWKVYDETEDGRYIEVTDPDRIMQACGEQFDPSAADTVITMNQKQNIAVAPSVRVYEPINQITLSSFSSAYLPVQVRMYINGMTDNITFPLIWKEEARNDAAVVLKARAVFGIDDLSAVADINTADYKAGYWFAKSDTAFEPSSWERFLDSAHIDIDQENSTAVLTMTAEVPEEELSELRRLNVIKKDVTRPMDEDVVLDTYYTSFVPRRGSDYGYAAPVLEHEDFVRWDDTIQEVVKDREYNLIAWVRPIIETAVITVDHPVIAGEYLPCAESVLLESDGRKWMIENYNRSIISNEWKTADESEYTDRERTAGGDVCYSGRYTFNSVWEAPEGERQLSNLANKFSCAKNINVIVQDINNTVLSDAQAKLEPVPGDVDAKMRFVVSFAAGRKTVTQIGEIREQVFDHGIAEDELRGRLAGLSVPVKLDDGSSGFVHTALPEEAGDYDPDRIDEQKFKVTAQLTGDEYDLGGFDAVEIPVRIRKASVTAVPQLWPDSGVYDDAVTLNITSSAAASVFIAVKTAVIRRDMEGKDITEIPTFLPQDYQLYSADQPVTFDEDYAGMRVYVSVFAREEGHADSPVRVNTYDVMNESVREAYTDMDGELQEEVLCRLITPDLTLLTDDVLNGWYAASDAVTVNGRIRVAGDVNLILADNAEMNAVNGIEVAEGSSLTIWCQNEGTGILKAGEGLADVIAAGIGGNEDGAAGTITINGGTVIALGGKQSAGIGTALNGIGGTITINNGHVSAEGGRGEAVKIETEQGEAEDEPKNGGAGIGGGAFAPAGTVIITGGTVEAFGNSCAYGIGGAGEEDEIILSWRQEDDYIETNGYSMSGAFRSERPFRFVGEEKKLEDNEIREAMNRRIVPFVWNEPEYIWSSDYRTVTATATRILDESICESETAETVEEVISAPDCGQDGESSFRAVFKNRLFRRQVKEYVIVPAAACQAYEEAEEAEAYSEWTADEAEAILELSE